MTMLDASTKTLTAEQSVIAIHDGNRRLFNMRIKDGVLVADYAPADLDAAAVKFVDLIMDVLGQIQP